MRLLSLLAVATLANAHYIHKRQEVDPTQAPSVGEPSVIPSVTEPVSAPSDVPSGPSDGPPEVTPPTGVTSTTEVPPGVTAEVSSEISSEVTSEVPSSVASDVSASAVSTPSPPANTTATNTTATNTTATNATVIEEDNDEGDDSWDLDDDIYPLPPAMQADEMALTLAYTANYDKAKCESLAANFAAASSENLRRHLAHIDYKRRRRSLVPLVCLPAAYQIPTTIHYVLPEGKTRAEWVPTAAMKNQLDLTKKQLEPMRISLDVRQAWVWSGPSADKFTHQPKSHGTDWAFNWVASAKAQTGTAAYNHLNVFIVEEAGDGSRRLNGYSNFPGISPKAGRGDAVVLGAYTIYTNKGGLKSQTFNDAKWGTTFAHEVGHWLSLKHLHQGGCDGGTDNIRDTLQYGPKVHPDYSKTCGGRDMDGGKKEHNLMSYSSGRTRDYGVFVQDQAIRASVGYFLRRAGLSYGDKDKQEADEAKRFARFLKSCKPKALTVAEGNIRVPRNIPALSKRQATDLLATYCQRSDLVIENHDFSQWADTGLYSPETPAIPTQPPIEAAMSVDPGQSQTTDDPIGSNIDKVAAQVEEQYDKTGSVFAPDMKPDLPPELGDGATSGGSGSGSGSGSGASSGVSLVAPVLLAVLCVAIAFVQ